MMPYHGHNSYQYQHQFPVYRHEETTVPPCPRCASSNTKFCYYNNYSLSQPRYFCKGCHRYWTKGGSLRNIPVGGGCRKRSRSSHNSRKRLCRNENPINQDDELQSSPACSDIDLAAVFAQYVTDRSPSSTTGSDQDSPVTTTTHDLDSLNWDTNVNPEFYGGFNNLLQEDEEEIFEFQSLLDDKEVQEILECSFSESDESSQLISQEKFFINGDNWSSTDLTRFGV